MPTPKAPMAGPLTGEEWQLLIQNGRLSRAKIVELIAYARKNYTTDSLPEGSTNLYFTQGRVMQAMSTAMADKASKADVKAAIDALINAAPGTLDTLHEIADAIGDDPNFAATMSAALSQRLRVDQAQSLTETQKATGRANLGMDKVSNTADADKPVSTATQTALDKKADKTQLPAVPVKSVAGKTGDVTLAKADVGLDKVENTADADKPVSTAQKTAIDKVKPPRVESATGTTVSTGIATITFVTPFDNPPSVDVIDGWNGEQQITGAVVAGSISKTGCQVQVMVSRGTLLLTSGPFQKAAAGVSISVRVIGN